MTEYVNTIADQFENQPMAGVMPSLLEAARRDPGVAQHLPAFHEARRAPVHAILRDATAAGEIKANVDADTALAELVGPLLFRRLILGDALSQDFRDAVVRDFLTAHGDSATGA